MVSVQEPVNGGGGMAWWLESPTPVPETRVRFPDEPPPGLPKPSIPLICEW